MANGAVGLLRQAFKDFGEDECATRAAALSYYTIFSLPPLLVLVLLVASLFVDPGDVERMLTSQFRGLMGPEGARAIEAMIRSVDRPGGKGLASLIGIAGLLFGATGAFLQLQAALNRAWEVKPDPAQGGIRRMLVKRVLSLGMVLGVCFLLLVSLAASTLISAAGESLGRSIGGGVGPAMQTAIDLALSLGIITVLFAAIFKVLPDARIAWRDVWVGALFTAVLFVVGKFIIGLYLGRSDPGEAFGAAGSLAVILVWIYYSSMIVLLGAEFTEVWAVRHGAGIQPEPGAVWIGPEPDAPEGAAHRPQRPVAVRASPPKPALLAARERNAAGRSDRGPSTLAVLAAALVDRVVRRRRSRA